MWYTFYKMTGDHHNPEHVFEEKERIASLSHIRELIFGAQDGLLVPLGVVSSVAGAFSNNHIVIIAGISEALAGAFSMASGAYLASEAEKQVHTSEMIKERKAIETYPVEEKQELVLMLVREGLKLKDAQIAVDKIATNEKSFFNTMVQKELGLEPEMPGTPLTDAVVVGLSYLGGATVPLFPYFFIAADRAILISILATFLALFTIGLLKGKFASLPVIKSGLQVLGVGIGSGIGGYLLGSYLPHLLGLK